MITSLHNSKIKELIQLKKKAKTRNEKNTYIIEGTRIFLEVPRDEIIAVYVNETFVLKRENLEILDGFLYEVIKDDIFKKICDTSSPQGILCVLKQKNYQLNEMFENKACNLLFLEGIQDPGNLGTIFRTAEGAGVTGIVLSKNSVDIYNPKTIRSTMGTIFRMPFVYVEDFYEAMKRVQKSGVKLFAASLEGKNFYYEENYKGSIGFLIGNEGNGLTKEALDLADIQIKIPMEGKLESLNAAIAASILMYEAYRQRR